MSALPLAKLMRRLDAAIAHGRGLGLTAVEATEVHRRVGWIIREAAERISGEWFRPSPRLLAFLNELAR